MTTNKYILDWVKEMAEMTCPDNIVWIDGSEEQAEKLRGKKIEPDITSLFKNQTNLYNFKADVVFFLVLKNGIRFEQYEFHGGKAPTVRTYF